MIAMVSKVAIIVGMKPLSERDENPTNLRLTLRPYFVSRNEATL